jgi:2-oxoglutarate dehydrogenase E1 component
VPDVDTGVPIERLRALLPRLVDVPDGFHVHPKIERYRAHFLETAEGARPAGWAVAEQLAFATLATAGVRVRLTGQDTERGTFGHRHAVWHDPRTGATHTPLQHLAPDQAPVEIANSPLSEMACVGFEYGYSLDAPDALVLWEAQFGDFANVAQVFIDQFVAAAEQKWRRLSGLVLLLPHGFEGQGPEHSSARLERFLALAAEDNLQLVQPTTPAQSFHVLRRQVLREWRKPLVVMAPKSLLRHPRSVSPLEELAAGRFRRVIGDGRTAGVRRVLACSGKVYYDLEAHREETGRDDVAIVRLEQLYPLPHAGLREALASYPDGTPVVWVQEEPENMGAWMFLRYHLGDRLLGRLPFSGVFRKASASPATGSHASHVYEQKHLIEKAFSA